MRAIRVHQPGGIDQLVIDELNVPVPSSSEVLVKANVIGVGRPDVLIRQGTYKWMPPLPAIPGAEMAGTIVALGSECNSWSIGDRVLISSRELPVRGGCYAEYICVDQSAPYRLASTISDDDAVSLPNLQLSLALMQAAGVDGAVSKPNAVLITGAAGGVATMLAQLASHWGMRVFGTARSAEKAQFAQSFGFTSVFDANPAQLAEAVLAHTNGQGVNLALDHLGGAYLPACIRSLAAKGKAISYNIVTGSPSEDVFGILRERLGKSLSVQCFSMHTYDADRAMRRALMEQAIDLMAVKAVVAAPAMSLNFSQVKEAHSILDAGQTLGKIILRP